MTTSFQIGHRMACDARRPPALTQSGRCARNASVASETFPPRGILGPRSLPVEANNLHGLFHSLIGKSLQDPINGFSQRQKPHSSSPFASSTSRKVHPTCRLNPPILDNPPKGNVT